MRYAERFRDRNQRRQVDALVEAVNELLGFRNDQIRLNQGALERSASRSWWDCGPI